MPGTFDGMGVTVFTMSCPSRRITMRVGRPACPYVYVMTWSVDGLVIPAMPTMRSPGCSPAMLAGVVRPDSVRWTAFTCGLVGSPENARNAANRAKANTKCVAGPATITSARCHAGLAPNVRGYSSGVGSWNGFIPAIRT